jgi:DNA-binding SARP family transcriptional activator
MIELRMLGQLDLRGADGQERSDVLVQPKRFALLAYLAVAGGGFVRRDTLLAVFWPDLDQAHARDALKQALSHLRRGLVSDDPVIVSRGAEELSVNPRVLWCDVTAFIDAVNAGHRDTALELYRGPLLDGFFANGSPEFDDWLSRERHRLRSMAGKSAQQLAQQAEDAGDLARALQLAERAAELSDLDERLLRQRVQLFNRAGDRAGAIRTYDDFARRLWAEHGAEPSAESHDLVERTRVQRTSTATDPLPLPLPRAAAQEARSDPIALVLAPRTHRVRRRGPLIAAALGGVAILAIATALVKGVGAKRPPIAPSPGVAAIMRFQVTSRDTALGRLRDGLGELLAAPLAADGGIRIDATNADRIIEGSVTGTSSHMVLTASIRSKTERRTGLPARAEGPLDSLAFLVDRLAGQLLALSAGVEGYRLESMSKASLPAIRLYLLGLEAWRKGKAETSREHFREAITSDSTFALAALDYARSLLVVGGGTNNLVHARALAVANQSQLSGVDRDLLGVTQFYWESSSAYFRQANSAVVHYPLAPELWYALGEAYYRDGVASGVDSSFERALDALRQGRALDSAAADDGAIRRAVPEVAQPTLSLVEMAHMRGDAAEVRRLARGVLESDSSSDLAGLVRWHVAALDGPAEQRVLLGTPKGASQSGLGSIAIFITFTGIDGADLPALMAEGDRRRRMVDAGNVGYRALAVALNAGRPSEARDGPSWVPSFTPRAGVRSRIYEALSWGGDTSAAQAAAEQLGPLADRPALDGPSAEPQYYDLCSVARWRVAHGDFAAAEAASKRLRAARVTGLAAYESGRLARITSLCAALLDAERATGLRLPDAERRLVVADSLSREMDPYEASYNEDAADANVLLAKLWERHGDLARALRAARRSGQWMRRPNYLTSFLLEEGRLAALTGDRAGAIHAYQRYLMLRYNPEPSVQPEVDQVRRDLGALLAGR